MTPLILEGPPAPTWGTPDCQRGVALISIGMVASLSLKTRVCQARGNGVDNVLEVGPAAVLCYNDLGAVALGKGRHANNDEVGIFRRARGPRATLAHRRSAARARPAG